MPSDAGRPGDPVGVAAAGHDEALELRALADDEAPIGGEGRPALEDAADPELVDGRNLRQDVLAEELEHLPVLLQELETEVGRNGLDHPWLGICLECPQKNAIAFAAKIEKL